MIQGFIKEIQIYPKEEQAKYKHPIRNITFNFPIIINGEEVDKISWENGNTVETCVLLSRKKLGGKSTKIEIEIDLSEADRRECIGTATYQEIKNYVWEHYQTKVSHLYIAQIKKKCGLDVGENFNKPKTEGNRVPNCPIEKERMIIEALEYFGMINKE